MAPQFDTTKMSSDEFRFIRLYCATVRADYHAVTTVIALTDTEELGLTCPFSAAKMAIGLQGMYREYAYSFAEIGAKHIPEKTKKECLPTLIPTLDDIGHIFSISFFKIVDASTQKSIVTAANKSSHDGWSSGRPSDWKHSLKSLHTIQKQKNPIGDISVVFSKLFAIFMGYTFSSGMALPPPTYGPDEDYEDEDEDYYDYDDYSN